jgi:hypothetical protein
MILVKMILLMEPIAKTYPSIPPKCSLNDMLHSDLQAAFEAQSEPKVFLIALTS